MRREPPLLLAAGDINGDDNMTSVLHDDINLLTTPATGGELSPPRTRARLGQPPSSLLPDMDATAARPRREPRPNNQAVLG